jgi:hypothetical protein
MILRLVVVLAALASIFMLPWPVTAALILAAGFFVPPASLALGVVADLAYFSPGAALFPYFSLYGAACTLVAVLVHRFVKTRIISG